MASVINGTNIILYEYDPITNLSVPFAAATACTFDVSVDQKEVTSQSSAWFREYKNDVATWTVKNDGFIILNDRYNYLLLLQKQIDRAPVQIKFSIDNDNGGATVLGKSVISGTCNITSISLSGSVESASTYSISLQGSGAYGISGTSPTPGGTVITAGGPVYMKQFTGAGGENSITWTDMIGKNLLSFSRGGIEAREIYTSGTPTGDQVVFISSTGEVKFGRALESDEFIRGIFQ
jgi:predicted secreted protein